VSARVAQPEFWERPKVEPPKSAIERSAELLHQAISEFQPTHIVSLVSGGRDSAASDEVARMVGTKVDFIMHGRTGAGIEETTEFVIDEYGNKGPNFILADAGTKYEAYVTRKGFFGVGREAHNFSYRILKKDPFTAALSREIIQRRRGFRVMLLTGARKGESDNRMINLPLSKIDKGKLWFNPLYYWSAGERDQLLEAQGVRINPVAKQLCRSGECMCGTMQSQADRMEASVLYPRFGAKINELDRIAKRKFGFGWGDPFPKPRDPNQIDMFDDFQPMCVGCARSTPFMDGEVA
jgi:3'-phosphoadenosine 5'-phosphosulfate sulfotransferase (PAPS reductase)/FAD synthetase